MDILSIVVWIFYLLVFVGGLAQAAAPRWCWETFSSWKATKEPTKAYFIMQRVWGIVIMIVVAAAASFPMIMAFLNR